MKKPCDLTKRSTLWRSNTAIFFLLSMLLPACQSFQKLDRVSDISDTYPVIDPASNQMSRRADFKEPTPYPPELKSYSFGPYQNENGKISKTMVKIIDR